MGERGSRGAWARVCGGGGIRGAGEDAGVEIGCWVLPRTGRRRRRLGSGAPSGVRTHPSVPASPASSLPGPLPPAAPVAFCFCIFAGRSPSCRRGNHGAHARRKLASIGGEAIPQSVRSRRQRRQPRQLGRGARRRVALALWDHSSCLPHRRYQEGPEGKISSRASAVGRFVVTLVTRQPVGAPLPSSEKGDQKVGI